GGRAFPPQPAPPNASVGKNGEGAQRMPPATGSSDGIAAPDWGLDTRLIHEAQEPDPQTGAVVAPIHPSATFARRSIDDGAHFRYARQANPTREVLEGILARLGHGAAAHTLGSGAAAATGAMQ